MTRHRSLLLALGTAAALTACQTDDVAYYKAPIEARQDGGPAPDGNVVETRYQLGDLKPNLRPDITSDEAGLWLLFDRLEKDTRTSGVRMYEARINDYLNSVVCRIAGPYCSDVRTYVMRIPYFNATMASNGMMQVWTGLLLRVRNEAQLATVIGHETGHYLRRHGLQRMRDIIDKSNTMVFVHLGLAAAGVPLLHDIANIMVQGSIQAFGRNHEREADGYGLLLMTQAGYDPTEAWKVWDQIERERNAVSDEPRTDMFLASHPASRERLENLKKLGKELKTPEADDIGRERFLEAILPIRAALLRDELNLRQYERFDALLKMLIEDGANVAELHYFRGEMHRLRADEDDLKFALEAYRRAEKAQGTPPRDLQRQIGIALGKLERHDESRAAFKRYLKENPDAADAAMIRHLIREKI